MPVDIGVEVRVRVPLLRGDMRQAECYGTRSSRRGGPSHS